MSRPKVDAARKVAYDVLKAVRLDGAYANLVLPELLRRADLSGRDAAFATELVSGTLRWQGTYDAIIDACLTKPRLEAKVRDVLRLGAHQLLAMRVPDHAAIATSVDLTRATIGVGPAGLVNAVLRKIASNDLAGWVSHVAPDRSVNRVAHLAVAYSHPTWIVETLAESLAASSHNAHEPGADSDQMEDLLVADNAAPSVGWWLVPAGRPATSCPASRRGGRPTVSRSRLAIRPTSRRSRSNARACRTRARNSSRSPWRRQDSWVATSAGSTSAPARAARPRCCRRWLIRLVHGWSRTNNSPIEPNSYAGHWQERAASSRSRSRTARRSPTPNCGARDRTTGSSSTRRARGWARCGAVRRRAGARGPTTCRD